MHDLSFTCTCNRDGASRHQKCRRRLTTLARIRELYLISSGVFLQTFSKTSETQKGETTRPQAATSHGSSSNQGSGNAMDALTATAYFRERILLLHFNTVRQVLFM